MTGQQVQGSLSGVVAFVEAVRAGSFTRAAERLGVTKSRVHIDMPIAFGKSVRLPILLGIATPHPEMALTMGFNDATVDLMRDEADLVIGFGQVEGSSQLVARKLSRPRLRRGFAM